MWRPAGFNESQPSAFDFAIANRPDVGKIMMTEADGNSLLKQTGYEQAANLTRKGLAGLTTGLSTLDNARVSAKQQEAESQANLVGSLGSAVGGIAGAAFDKFGSSGGGPFSNGGVGNQWNNAADLGSFGIGSATYRNPYG